jgi:hypothetical protein
VYFAVRYQLVFLQYRLCELGGRGKVVGRHSVTAGPCFDPRPVHVMSMVGKVALGQGLFELGSRLSVLFNPRCILNFMLVSFPEGQAGEVLISDGTGLSTCAFRLQTVKCREDNEVKWKW